MKPQFKLPCTILATALSAVLQLAAIAAVPVAWTNSPGMPPYPIKPLPHGSTVDLAVTLKGYTTPPIADGADVRLWYQTNGMGSAWWSAPATFDGSTITASFGPAQDCGADRVSLFFGAPSNVFASAVLRLTHAPGFDPARLPLPVQYIDFATVELRNLSALGNYSVVSNAAMSAAPKYKSKFNCQWVYYDGIRHLLSGGEPWGDAIATWGHSHLPRLSSCSLEYLGAGVWRFWTGSATPDPDYKVVTNSEDAVVLDFGGNYLLTKTNDVKSAVVYSDELPPAISSVVTKSYVEDLGIESGIQSEEDPVWSTDKPNYATTSEVGEMRGDIEEMRAENAIVYRLYQGSNVVAEVTNCNSAVHAPTLRLMQLNESNEYVTVWAETNGLTRTLNEAKEYADGATNELKNVYAPRAWSRTTSGLGADAPSNTTWISTEKLVIASGQEYVEIESSGVWVLCTNGQVDFSAKTNSFFTISDNSGNPVFSVERAGAAPIPVYCGEIRVHNSGDSKIVTVPVPVFDVTENKNDPPYLNVATDLQGTWYSETNGIPSSIVTSCTWSGQNGAWTNTVVVPATHQHVFFTYHKWQPGGTIIRNNATTDLSFGIYVNGVKFVPSVSGNNLIWTKQ